MRGSRRAARTGTPPVTLAPGDLGTMDDQNRYHGHAWVGQDPGGPVGFERHRAQGGGKGVAAMPQPPGRVELQVAAIVFGIDHEYPTGADHQVIDIGPATRNGQVMQDSPPLSLKRPEQPGGAPLPHRPPSPGDGVRAGPEPQPPAGGHGRERGDDQAQLGRYQVAEDSHTGTDPQDGGHPPGKGSGPRGPLHRPQPPPPCLG